VQTEPGTEVPGAPNAMPLSGAPAVQEQPELPRPAVAQPTTPPPPKPTKKKPSEAVPAPVETAPPPPVPAPAAPAAQEPAPVEQEPPVPPGSAGVDQFKEMEELVVGIASFSEKAMDSHEEAGGGDELFNRLQAFNEAAVGAKREFRKATGTGLRGAWSKLRGKSGDNRALEIKVQDLARRADEIDRLIGASSSTTQDYWKEVRGKLRRLKGYF
jgi:hypothetical protein